ncbi:hypothetical protein LXD69_12040 [Flavobacterium sediminilitoris]|uniref:GreA/GreB family transcription elongation factor n=1 Tax=Flavobacterium sediminilitoris TaxID=2024526 RepID=A0ABY4HJD5_9FLAO|nr:MULTISPECIES: hypothetical protein [Flavobacterium]UOX32766.1 hypothetical protein LXD69_12040 [Flavobacterium sediminilitoris]
MNLKQKMYNHYCNLLEEKIKTLRNRIADLAEDAQNDAKGSAGDKHETALSMMHLEQEKLNHNLKEVLDQKSILENIDITLVNKYIGLGSLIYTDKFIFFISLALPKIEVDGKEIIALSLHSPLGKEMKGKKKEETFTFNKTNHKIVKIE